MSLLDAALSYAEAGWPVIPLHSPNGAACDCANGAACSSPAKHPRTLNGLKNATTDPERIRGMWGRWPSANVGLVVPEDGVVVDVDGPEGVDAIKVAKVEMPMTAVAKTGRGWHYLYATDHPIRPAVGILDHVDLRGPGSYIVAPPSVHANGRRYVWKTPFEDRAPAPAWIAEKAEVSRRRDLLAEDPAEPIREGERNAHLASLAGSMRHRGFPEAAIRAALLEVNRARCMPPLAEDEVAAIAASVARYVPGGRPEVAEVVTFPEPENRGRAVLSDLGGVEYVEDIGRPGRIVVAAAEEGTGKSFAMVDELGIRVAVARGSFMGTWPVITTGNVLVLSEMHPDDDYQREETVLGELGLTRADLDGHYFRLSLFTAANGAPALMDDAWREFIISRIRELGIILAVFDTGTAATNVDPWGKDMQQVFRNAKQILEAVPELLIVFVVHLKKPQGRGGERGLSAVLGEWGRWNDVTILMENDGASLERVKVTTRKRVRHERRFIVTKRGGLLVEPLDIESNGPKVQPAAVIAVVAASPGLSTSALAERLGVARGTVRSYAANIPQIVGIPGNRGATTWHLADGGNEGTDMSLTGGGRGDVAPGNRLYRKAVPAMSPHPLTDSSPEETEEELLEQLRLDGGGGAA